MHQAIRQLLILQDRDQKILSYNRNLEKIPRDQTDVRRKLTDDEAAMTKAHDLLQQCEVNVKKVELDIGTRRTTIARLKQQQFETRKNEEFTALGNEVIRYEKEIDALETRVLELMEQVDGQRAEFHAAEERLRKARSLADESMKELEEKQKNLSASKTELETERGALMTDVAVEIISLYDKLMKTKGGQAVVAMTSGMCGGCHMKLVPSTLVKVSAGKEITQCENCGRILYPD
jgi:predicted  nucleic acid-binding Zn-ribbon protein